MELFHSTDTSRLPWILYKLTPATWKRTIGIPPGKDRVKDMARAEACRRWPVAASCFAAKGSDGIAEAALIAVAGMQREGQGR